MLVQYRSPGRLLLLVASQGQPEPNRCRGHPGTKHDRSYTAIQRVKVGHTDTLLGFHFKGDLLPQKKWPRLAKRSQSATLQLRVLGNIDCGHESSYAFRCARRMVRLCHRFPTA